MTVNELIAELQAEVAKGNGDRRIVKEIEHEDGWTVSQDPNVGGGWYRRGSLYGENVYGSERVVTL